MRANVKKLTLIAILTSIALIIFIIEAQIPLPIPIPGVKLGLANVITLFALFFNRVKREPRMGEIGRERASEDLDANCIKGEVENEMDECDVLSQKTDFALPCSHRSQVAFTTVDVFAILLCRIILGAVFTGRLIAFAYSITGGLLGFVAQIVMRRVVSNKQIWVCGAVGAVFHNIGQILAAAFITGTPAIIGYLPILIIVGVITGVLTGMIAQLALERFSGKL